MIVGWIPMADQVADNYWWPWMKNYSGEIETGYENKMPMIDRVWIGPIAEDIDGTLIFLICWKQRERIIFNRLSSTSRLGYLIMEQ